MYNVVQDLLVKVHRDEKMARATTAVIRAEKLASDASESSTPDSKPDVRIETDAAIYEDGKVTLKGNPLQTTKDIICPRCHLPRLLHPTDGKGAKKPDPSVIYCKKHPYIDKPGYDIYGQTWVQPGPGRGKKKKDMKPDPNIELVNPANPDQRPPNVLSFPSATCSKCKRCILVTRLNNHMGSCIGNSGRNASRAAAAKISNGSNGNTNSNDPTPPSSQKATPAPGSRASSPKKRDSDAVDEEEDGSDASGPKKKKLKPSPMTKKVILKNPKAPPKKDKVKTNSGLSVEQKVDDEDDDTSTVEVAPKKKVDRENGISKGISPVKKLKTGNKPPLSSPMGKNGKDRDAESESSGTLSSPPVA